TALSNLVLLVLNRRDESTPNWMVPAILLLDVTMFTILLGLTGGTENPFSLLYAIHVAMAVVVLGGGWALFIVALSAISYTVVSFHYLPLSPHLPQRVWTLGQWSSLVLVMALIAYFIER